MVVVRSEVDRVADGALDRLGVVGVPGIEEASFAVHEPAAQIENQKRGGRSAGLDRERSANLELIVEPRLERERSATVPGDGSFQVDGAPDQECEIRRGGSVSFVKRLQVTLNPFVEARGHELRIQAIGMMGEKVDHEGAAEHDPVLVLILLL